PLPTAQHKEHRHEMLYRYSRQDQRVSPGTRAYRGTVLRTVRRDRGWPLPPSTSDARHVRKCQTLWQLREAPAAISLPDERQAQNRHGVRGRISRNGRGGSSVKGKL